MLTYNSIDTEEVLVCRGALETLLTEEAFARILNLNVVCKRSDNALLTLVWCWVYVSI